jgi:DNA-binding HxlR family transcriptional regulator
MARNLLAERLQKLVDHGILERRRGIRDPRTDR